MKKENTKDQIILAAMEIVAKNGLEGLSAKKIADHLQISKSNVFHHYPQLDLLKEKLLKHLVDQLLSWPDSFFLDIDSVDLLLEKLISDLFNMKEDDKIGYVALLQFHTACLYHPSYREKFIEAKARAVKKISQFLAHFSKADRLSIHHTAESIIVTLDGVGIHYLLEENHQNIEEIWKMQCHLWKNTLKL